MSTPVVRARPVWVGAILAALQFAAIATILYYVAPFDSSKGLTAGLVVFIIAFVVALVAGIGWV